MTIIRVAGFLGANIALQPMLLPETVGVSSLNSKPGRGDLRPWKAPLNVATVPAGRQTIHRMGRDVASDTNYWLSWTTDVHVVVAPNADDTAERTYYSGGAAFAPKWTNTTLALAAAPYPTAYRELGVPAPASACTLLASGGTSAITETRFYTYTYVSDIGEESAPAAPSLQLACKSDDTVTISALAAAPAGAYGINRIRIYRTQDNSSGADFYFLREIASTLTTTTDDNRDLGEVLPTTTWLMPPANLSHLTGLWNGMMAGISGRSIRFCEAYTFYAWPLAYEILPSNAQPVALATFGQNLVVLTNGNPSLITGGSPESMDEQPVEFAQACVAPLSAVGMGHGVAWASPDGLAYVGAGGARLLTQGIMTRDDWQALNPSSIEAVMYEGRYHATYTVGGVKKGFVLDPANPNGIYFLDFGFDAMHLDELQDALYVLDGVNVQKFDAGAAKTVTFKSKLFHQPAPIVGFACAKVIAESFPVTFNLYADGVLKHTQTVANAQPFRLPSGYRAQDFQIEVSTTGAIQFVAMAHSMQELAQT
jgi:hypothetical protein